MEDNFLVQHVDEPSHTSGNILDLVISNDDQLVQNEGRHKMIMATLKIEMSEFGIPSRSRNYNRANFSEMRKEVRNVECWCIIKTHLDDLVDKLVPWKRPRKGSPLPKWMNAE